MANYHFTMKPISRSAGRSSTAAAAYRSGRVITDERTGEVFDYTRKQRVESSDLFFPAGCQQVDGPKFWNAVEHKHKRGDAVTAREFEVSLPFELPPSERKRLAHDFARELSAHYQVGAEADIHSPGDEGDDRNHHCHILLSACQVTPDGLGNKVAELDPIHCKRHQIPNPAEQWRKRWADLTNERLAENGIDARVDHRSFKERGIDQTPQPHLGPAAVGYERRTGLESDVRARAREKAAQQEEQKRAEAELKSARKKALHLGLDHTMAKDDLVRAEKIDQIETRRARKAAEEKAAPAKSAILENVQEVLNRQDKINEQIQAAAPETPPAEKLRTVTAEELEKEPIPEKDQAAADETIDRIQEQQDLDQDQENGLAPGI